MCLRHVSQALIKSQVGGVVMRIIVNAMANSRPFAYLHSKLKYHLMGTFHTFSSYVLTMIAIDRYQVSKKNSQFYDPVFNFSMKCSTFFYYLLYLSCFPGNLLPTD